MMTDRERPILFSGDMVRAILDGRKTQTRRVIEPQPKHLSPICPYQTSQGKWAWVLKANGIGDGTGGFCCPYGQPGDKLWVRESFWISDCNKYITYGRGDDIRSVLRISDKQVYRGNGDSEDGEGYPRHRFMVCYYGDQGVLVSRGRHAFELGIGEYDTSMKIDPGTGNTQIWSKNILFKKRKPSIHMPRWASRILLDVVDVSVERVQDISRQDIVAEGINDEFARRIPLTLSQLRARFWGLWDKINKKRGFGRDVNPWVWKMTFKVAR